MNSRPDTLCVSLVVGAIALSAGCSGRLDGDPYVGEWKLWTIDGLTIADAPGIVDSLVFESGVVAYNARRTVETTLTIYADGDYESTGVLIRRRGISGAQLQGRVFDAPAQDTSRIVGTWRVEGDSILLFLDPRPALRRGYRHAARTMFPEAGEEVIASFVEDAMAAVDLDSTRALISGSAQGDKLVLFDRRSEQLHAFRRLGDR